MAFAHIYFNQNTQYGSKLRNLMNLIESGDDEFTDIRDLMLQMRDGDGTQDAHYAEVAKKFGFGDYDVTTGGAPSAFALAKARAAFEEIDSCYAKTSGNGSVSNVRAARDQMLAKLR